MLLVGCDGRKEQQPPQQPIPKEDPIPDIEISDTENTPPTSDPPEPPTLTREQLPDALPYLMTIGYSHIWIALVNEAARDPELLAGAWIVGFHLRFNPTYKIAQTESLCYEEADSTPNGRLWLGGVAPPLRSVFCRWITRIMCCRDCLLSEPGFSGL